MRASPFSAPATALLCCLTLTAGLAADAVAGEAADPADAWDRPGLEEDFGRGALERGREVFERTCIRCHGDPAGSAPLIGDVSGWEPRLDQGLQELVRHALEGHGGEDGMPPKGGFAELGNEEVAAAVSYIVHESRSLGPEAARIVAACGGTGTDTTCTPQMARRYLILYLFQGLSGKNR
ncbi:MAG: c-type cytochrome [Chromatiales bacterium]